MNDAERAGFARHPLRVSVGTVLWCGMEPATLSNLIANDNDLRLFCDGCGRCVDADISRLVKRFGAAIPLPEIGRRSRCSECGAKGGSVQVVAVRWST